MRRIAALILAWIFALALAALAAPQVSSFYDPAADDWITYAVTADGYVYRILPDGPRELGQIPGSGPYDVSAFYDNDYDDYIIYGSNNAGEFFQWAGGSFEKTDAFPGSGPFSLSAFYDIADDDYIIYGCDGAGNIYRYYQSEVVEVGSLP